MLQFCPMAIFHNTFVRWCDVDAVFSEPFFEANVYFSVSNKLELECSTD